MILRSLTLHDFGAYAGRQHLDLTPAPDRPVILVGGTNGAGKTTLLEALLLCLHGRRGLWPQISLAEYQRRLAGRIHQPVGAAPPAEASVELVLDHTDGGVTEQYLVRRSWRRTRSGTSKETLHLARGGEVVEDITGSMHQEFLDSLVPPGLAGLFFFDGEKIQDLADDDPSGALRDAVRRLLGLDLLDRLSEDLDRFVLRDAASQANEELSSAALAAREALDAATAARGRADEAVRLLHDERAQLESRLAGAEDRFSQEGGSVVAERRRLQEQLTSATTDAERAGAQLHEMVAGLLPLAICPDIADRLQARLVSDEQGHADNVIRERLDSSAEALRRTLRPAAPGADVVGALVDALLSDARPGPAVHDVSPGTRSRMLADLAQVRGGVPDRARQAAAVMQAARDRSKPLRAAVEGAAEDAVVAPLLREIQDLSRKRGRLDERIAKAVDDVRHHEHLQRVAERTARGAMERLAAADGVSERAARAARTAKVVADFEQQVGLRRIAEIEVQTAKLFNRLSRKGRMLSGVVIDPATFGVELLRWDRTAIRKAQLSAGERQLFAIAVLWALASVSGRPLPVVVDTPLARLDRVHREKLLREYFPEVSAQVIVLSTDTEIDEVAARILQPSVARTYRLEHDAAAGATSVLDGYFDASAQVPGGH